MSEIKEKIFFKRWFCNHKNEALDDLRGFFGITQCIKCGQWSQLPEDQMQVTEFKIPPLNGER